VVAVDVVDVVADFVAEVVVVEDVDVADAAERRRAKVPKMLRKEVKKKAPATDQRKKSKLLFRTVPAKQLKLKLKLKNEEKNFCEVQS
jgi:hypothetical protein